jgi:hypothetical protein
MVSAMQYLGQENWDDFQNFMLAAYQPSPPRYLYVVNENGQTPIAVGDWVFRDSDGRIKVVSDDPNSETTTSATEE